ncbi:MAG: glycyl-radical enzyme activating protein [Ignavibacteriaceae bacterium]|nr:glycyl-radical enzyme activating protein [Ignavibacteriaceae bacterium]
MTEVKTNTSGVIFDIKRFAIHDGPGIRTTVFFKGCPLRCLWCHNPESHKILPEKFEGCNFRGNINHSLSSQNDEVGREVTILEVMKEIEKDSVFYEQSGGGVTFSGGEPTIQPDFLFSLLKECNEMGLHTTVDTCGYVPTRVFEKIIDYTDLFLYDLKLINDELHHKYTGVSNKVIHTNLKWLDNNDQNICIRIPVVPGITDAQENISETINFLTKLDNISEISLLPYHRAGEGKYSRFKKENKFAQITTPENGYMQKVVDQFKILPHKIKIGG